MTTPRVTVPVEGQSFANEQEWINRASRVLTAHPDYNNTEHGETNGWRGNHFTALCFDQAGNRMRCGADFKRATKEATYPVWWVWPDQIAAMLTAAPVREEGGAVETAVKIATDLHRAYEQLIYGLPKYLEAENLTDEENMIREAWITLDVTAHRLAALATREEAPAEVGELWPLVVAMEDFLNEPQRRPVNEPIEVCDYRHDAYRVWSPLCQAIAALRAQPPAREDAQPVPFAYMESSALIKLSEGPKDTVYGGVRLTMPGLARKKDSLVPLYTHPAPAALWEDSRAWGMLADLVSWFTKPVQGQNGMVWVIPAGEQGADDAVNAALSFLAALQAEQKGGA